MQLAIFEEIATAVAVLVRAIAFSEAFQNGTWLHVNHEKGLTKHNLRPISIATRPARNCEVVLASRFRNTTQRFEPNDLPN